MINNVETLINVPGIILDGGTEYVALGTPASSGHKLFSISGHVARPGVYEAEFGLTLRDLIALAGGVPGGRAVKTVNLGGAAGVFVGPEAMDVPLTYEHAKAIGATLGAGAVVVFDETTDIADILRRIARSSATSPAASASRAGSERSARRSCWRGWRRGGPTGRSRTSWRCSRTSGQVLRDASICGLGQMANDAVRTGLRFAEVPA